MMRNLEYLELNMQESDSMIDATNLTFDELNRLVRESKDKEIIINNILGQRYIASSYEGVHFILNGTIGNACGCYLNGSKIDIYGNTSDALGDTMNDGEIIVHGHAGDTVGYAMRGGEIYIDGDVGYRTGIHMKSYLDKVPSIIVGGCAGDFLGEYLAGGVIIILNKDNKKRAIGEYAATGMHGGVMYIRGNIGDYKFPSQVVAEVASEEDLKEIEKYLVKYENYFNKDLSEVRKDKFIKVSPNSKNPYKQLYCAN